MNTEFKVNTSYITPKRSALEIIEAARPKNPGKRFAVSGDGCCIGVWSDTLNRYVCVASVAINGEWYQLDFEPGIRGVTIDYSWCGVN